MKTNFKFKVLAVVASLATHPVLAFADSSEEGHAHTAHMKTPAHHLTAQTCVDAARDTHVWYNPITSQPIRY